MDAQLWYSTVSVMQEGSNGGRSMLNSQEREGLEEQVVPLLFYGSTSGFNWWVQPVGSTSGFN